MTNDHVVEPEPPVGTWMRDKQHAPDFCQHDDCDQPPTCWVCYYAPEGEVIGAIFTCDSHQAEYIEPVHEPTAADGTMRRPPTRSIEGAPDG